MGHQKRKIAKNTFAAVGEEISTGYVTCCPREGLVSAHPAHFAKMGAEKGGWDDFFFFLPLSLGLVVLVHGESGAV